MFSLPSRRRRRLRQGFPKGKFWPRHKDDQKKRVLDYRYGIQDLETIFGIEQFDSKSEVLWSMDDCTETIPCVVDFVVCERRFFRK